MRAYVLCDVRCVRVDPLNSLSLLRYHSSELRKDLPELGNSRFDGIDGSCSLTKVLILASGTNRTSQVEHMSQRQHLSMIFSKAYGVKRHVPVVAVIIAVAAGFPLSRPYLSHSPYRVRGSHSGLHSLPSFALCPCSLKHRCDLRTVTGCSILCYRDEMRRLFLRQSGRVQNLWGWKDSGNEGLEHHQ